MAGDDVRVARVEAARRDRAGASRLPLPEAAVARGDMSDRRRPATMSTFSASSAGSRGRASGNATRSPGTPVRYSPHAVPKMRCAVASEIVAVIR